MHNVTITRTCQTLQTKTQHVLPLGSSSHLSSLGVPSPFASPHPANAMRQASENLKSGQHEGGVWRLSTVWLMQLLEKNLGYIRPLRQSQGKRTNIEKELRICFATRGRPTRAAQAHAALTGRHSGTQGCRALKVGKMKQFVAFQEIMFLFSPPLID